MYCVVYGGLGSTEHWVQLCVLTIIECIMDVLGKCCGDLVNGQIFLYDLCFFHTCVFFYLLTQFTLTPPSPHPLLLHVMEMR